MEQQNNSSPSKRSYIQFINRDKDFRRADYKPEQDFYACIAEGDIERTRLFTQQKFTRKEGLGVLSKDPLQSMRYHLAITAALIARGCIAMGMEHSLAYDLSDYYIQHADAARDTASIDELHTRMCLDYAGRMKETRRRNVLSSRIAKVVDYIYDHLHTRIRLADLAANAGVSPEHLSRTFRAETGKTITDYILEQKLETAANMLRYSDYNIAEISSILAFADQSYFTKKFRQRFGKTPAELRFHNNGNGFTKKAGKY